MPCQSTDRVNIEKKTDQSADQDKGSESSVISLKNKKYKGSGGNREK